ncbi:MAG TPA: TolC family protein, partial [Candidatus Elarobacter sp.]
QAPQGGALGNTITQRLTTVGGQITLGDLAQYGPLVAQAAAQLRAAQTDEAVAERAERVKTIGLYYAALKAHAIAGARADALASAQAFAKAAQTRFGAGDAPRIDVVRAQLAEAKAQSDLAHAKADDANALDALEREAGLTAGTLGSTTTAPIAETPVLTADKAVARAIAQRGDLRSADENVRAAQAGVAAAQHAAFPPVTLSAGYTHGVDSGVNVHGPTINAQIAIPIGNAAGAKVRVQRALVDAATAKREGVARQIATEVGAASRTAQAAVEAQRASDTALSAAKAELDAATLGYRNGASSSLDLSSARSAYAQAEVDALSARYDRLQSQATLDLEVSE